MIRVAQATRRNGKTNGNQQETSDEIQRMMLKLYVEHLVQRFQHMVAGAIQGLSLTLLVPPQLHAGLCLLRTLGYPRTHLPKAFATSKPLPLLPVHDALCMILLKLPNHIAGFQPEQEFALRVYGDSDTPCLHQVLVLQCRLDHVHTLWKTMGWPTSRDFQRNIKHYRGYGSLEGEDVALLLQNVAAI